MKIITGKYQTVDLNTGYRSLRMTHMLNDICYHHPDVLLFLNPCMLQRNEFFEMEFAQPPPNMMGAPPTHMPPPNMSMPPPGQNHYNKGFDNRPGYNRPQFRPFLNLQRPLPGPLGNMTLEDFDGKRLRKSVMRKTVDYNSSIIKALEVRRRAMSVML